MREVSFVFNLDVVLMILLLVAMVAFFFKIIWTRYVWNRLLLLNLISTKILLFLAFYAIISASELLLDIALTYGIISFLTMTLFSKFVIAGGKGKE
jgi:multicomponent Na+:H+ antiporter subunit F